MGTVRTIDIHKEKGKQDQMTSSCDVSAPSPRLWPVASALSSSVHLALGVRRPGVKV